MAALRKAPSQAQFLPPQFPLMSTTEIVSILDALGIAVKAEDLGKPNAQTAQIVYAALLDALMGAPMEMLEGPKAALMGMMEYKELYGDALQFTMFYRHCRQLATVCGINNFSIADLTRPDPSRFRSQMSGIMNFAKFREERSPFQSNLQARVQRQAEKTVRLRRQLDEIEGTIEDITAKNVQDKPLTEEAKKRNEALRNELLSLRSEQVKLSHEVEDLKKERQSVMEQAASKNHELTTLTAANASARSRLVQSPERIKRHIGDMSTTVATERATYASFQRKARELGNRLEVIGGLEMDLKGLIDLEKGIDEQRGKVEEARRAMMVLKARLDGKKIEGEGLTARLDQLDRQLRNAEDKLTRQQEMGRDMRERAKHKVDSLKQEYVVRAKERGVWQKERDRLLAEQKELEGEIAEFVALHESEINELLQEYWTMRKQAEDYMNTVTVKLGLKLKL